MPIDVLPEEVEQLKLLNGLTDDMPIELTAGQLRKLLATATAEAEKRERERILEQLYKLTTARCNVYTEVPSAIDVVVSRDAVHNMIEAIQKGTE